MRSLAFCQLTQGGLQHGWLDCNAALLWAVYGVVTRPSSKRFDVL